MAFSPDVVEVDRGVLQRKWFLEVVHVVFAVTRYQNLAHVAVVQRNEAGQEQVFVDFLVELGLFLH